MFTSGALKNIPKDLLYIFEPSSTVEREDLEVAYAKLQKKEIIRDAVMTLQKKYNLPLDPKETPGHIKTRITLKEKLKIKFPWDNDKVEDK